MANSVILLQRNASPDGVIQSVDVLVNRPPDWWLWSVQGVDATLSDSQVQNFLDGQISTILAQIDANGEVPLTADQLSNYQNVIDLQQLQTWLDTLKADLDLITTASPDSNALTGYRDAFKAANFNPLTNAARFELIRATMFALLGIAVDAIKAERILLKRAKRAADSGNMAAALKQ